MGYLLHRGGLLVGRQQIQLESFVQPKSLTRPKNVLGATIHPFEANCFLSNSIIKSFKSIDAKKRNLNEKRQLRRFSQEEDQQILEHVSTHGKGPKSYKHIAEILDRSYDSVYYRCKLLLSDNEFDSNTDPKHWKYEEDEKLVNSVLICITFNCNRLFMNCFNQFQDVLYQVFRRYQFF